MPKGILAASRLKTEITRLKDQSGHLAEAHSPKLSQVRALIASKKQFLKAVKARNERKAKEAKGKVGN